MPFSRFARVIEASILTRRSRFDIIVFVHVLMLVCVPLIPVQAQTCQQVTPGIAGWHFFVSQPGLSHIIGDDRIATLKSVFLLQSVPDSFGGMPLFLRLTFILL